jgi:hypothetical protein
MFLLSGLDPFRGRCQREPGCIPAEAVEPVTPRGKISHPYSE